MIYNFHTHSVYSDGRNSLEDIVKNAIKENVSFLGFSDHSPVPFASHWNMQSEDKASYIKEINELKDKYPEIKLFAGIEGDFIPGFQDFSQMQDFEYIIGSVHYTLTDGEPLGFDSNPTDFKKIINKHYKNDIMEFIKYYYNSLLKMIDTCNFDFLGHLDLVKKFNTIDPMFDENSKEYRSKVIEVLNFAKEKDLAIEINVGGINRNVMKEPYPSFQFIKEAKKLDIPVCINSDAHNAKDIIKSRNIALEAIKSAGYKYELIPVLNEFQTVK